MVIYGIRGIRRKEGLLNRIIERANQVSKDEIKPLEKEKQTKEKELEEVKETIRRFLNSLRDGTKTLKLIEDELEELESRQEELEREVNLFSIRIEEKRRYAVNGVILKDHLQEFDLIFDHLKPLDKQRLLHILLREVIFSGDKIKISLWDLPQTGLSLQETITTNWFANSQIWLPEDRAMRNFKDILKVEVIKGKGHPHRLKVLAH